MRRGDFGVRRKKVTLLFKLAVLLPRRVRAACPIKGAGLVGRVRSPLTALRVPLVPSSSLDGRLMRIWLQGEYDSILSDFKRST